MFKKLFLTFFLLIGSFITIYPSKKEKTNFFNYCHSLEKIISRNSLEEIKNLSKKFIDLETFLKNTNNKNVKHNRKHKKTQY